LQSSNRIRSLLIILAAYIAALAAAGISGYLVREQHPLVVAGVADAVGTVVIFLFSVRFSNSSFYDAYWSVAPIALGAYWMWAANDGVLARQVLVLALVTWWGVRLTYNWARGWQGLAHEDWRYLDLRAKTGASYWLVSFAGIHFFPTVIVFVGCLGLYVAMTADSPLNWIDGLAAMVTGGAVLLEMVSDKQLRRFVLSKPPRKAVLQSGLWAYSRHPNYLGEVSFWTGLFLFALAADRGAWWTAVGPVSMLILFLFISIPMIERRHLKRRPAYAEVQARVPMLFPFPRR
jgi:steroid 5-alpha reductase family enzyme